ncbi:MULTISPECIES: hypothetical protein [Pseudomonas]|uniref:hypothetical protein n=1 Tax=Pseudomonas TaxID=286 RepID=UPI00117F2994|nr:MULTISPECIES: hypothetical protein [Pseudomonas]MBB4057282.1 hypothetical protein [Pseudomonas koreensis]TSB50244.1 hypothetical protein FEE99_20735 [Pseudomonas sp. ef1]
MKFEARGVVHRVSPALLPKDAALKTNPTRQEPNSQILGIKVENNLEETLELFLNKNLERLSIKKFLDDFDL